MLVAHRTDTAVLELHFKIMFSSYRVKKPVSLLLFHKEQYSSPLLSTISLPF